MRAFVAIDLPDAVRDALETVQDRIPAGRPTDPETFHLTLAFLGEVPDAELDEMHLALDAIEAAPFQLQLRGLGTFGKSPKVLWAGVEKGPDLARLRGKVRGAARQAGIELRRERFKPHVTLARFDAPPVAEELDKLRLFLERFQSFPAPPFEVTHVTLFRSILTKSGAVHEPLADYPLREAPEADPA